MGFWIPSWVYVYNLLRASVPFVEPLKMSENHSFSGVVSGYRNGTLAWNGLRSNEKQKQPPEVFYIINAFKNYVIFIGKHLCWSLFLILIKLQASRPATLLKRDSSPDVFLLILRIFEEHLFWRTSTNSCFWKKFSIINFSSFQWKSSYLVCK